MAPFYVLIHKASIIKSDISPFSVPWLKLLKIEDP